MSSKKNKSKIRGKLTQDTENLVVVEKNNNIEVVKADTTNTEKTEITDIVNESITNFDNEQTINIAPKKPKRTKGKKKKDTEIEEHKSVEQKSETKKEVQEILEVRENIAEEVLPVTPNVRKKKKKIKNLDDSKENKEVIVTEYVGNDADKVLKEESNANLNVNNITSDNNEVCQKNVTCCKKRKKKKHRNDSEKSDIYDPCTIAFQKLLEPSNVPIEICTSKASVDFKLSSENISNKENIEIKEELVIDSYQIQDICKSLESQNDFASKELIKNKKHPLDEEVCVKKEIVKAITERTPQNISNADVVISENCLDDFENMSPKPKAKIAKPVQKKRKVQTIENASASSLMHNIESNINEKATNECLKGAEIIQCTNNDKSESLENKEGEVQTSSLGERLEVFNIEHDNDQVNKTRQCYSVDQEIKQPEIITALSDNLSAKQEETSTNSHDDKSNLDFVPVKTGKNKKKRNKSSSLVPEISEPIQMSLSAEVDSVNKNQNLNFEKDETEAVSDVSEAGVEGNNVKEENTQQIIIPDLIEYPRSTSQQFIDNNNNNTTIQEITTPDEVKLHIPIYIPTPIIQGSGESPEPKNINKPMTINVTEINTVPENCNTQLKNITYLECTEDRTPEKNDIKSKIIEVNRDMEELRRSIERSLAELSVIEKCDSEVDKEFEEIFQNQSLESMDVNEETNINTKYSIDIETKKSDINKTEKSALKTTQEPIFGDYISSSPVTINTENLCNFNKDANVLNPLLLDNLKNIDSVRQDNDNQEITSGIPNIAPVCPARKDRGKNKCRKKNKKGILSTDISITTTSMSSTHQSDSAQDTTQKSTSEKTEQKPKSTQEKGKQQNFESDSTPEKLDRSLEPIEKFEDALTSSVDDVHKTFEIIVEDTVKSMDLVNFHNNPQINIVSPTQDIEPDENNVNDNEKMQKQNPISQPKNLLGHPNIPASSNKTDYKKEKHKPPSSIEAKVKIKESGHIEKCNKQPKKGQAVNDGKLFQECNGYNNFTYLKNTYDDLIYKYNFRKVFLQSTCHVCNKHLVNSVPCKFCTLVFYCSQKHKDEDWPQHQALCFAVSTIAHLKDQKYIYGDAQNIAGYDYRVLRMQMILSCEKILNRKLVPWEQEALLYPRMCVDVKCRQWKPGKLKDCEGCGQISYCVDHSEHLPSSHQRWCKSYALYQKLTNYQQTKGRLEISLPTKILKHYQMPDKINDVLGSIYEEKIDMDDIQYAVLTQIATVPLTTAHGYQVFCGKINSTCANGVAKKSTFTVHTVGAELPFEIDALNQWEIFFLHLRSDVQDLKVVVVGQDLDCSKLPMDLIGKIKLCEDCEANKRRVLFDFYDNKSYQDYYLSEDFVTPDIVCAFNANIQRSSIYNADMWPANINCILKQRVPFIVTSYTIEELRRDLATIREFAGVDFNIVSEIKHNPFSSVRPDRNFITDHEIPLLFKNYCFCVLCGTF